jgi:hypothetical protein
MVSFYFFKEPRLKHPPPIDLPDPTNDPDFYGEVWIRYPQDKRSFPIYFGQVFKACIRLRIILNEIATALFSDDQVKKSLTTDEANGFAHQLQVWFTALPAVISPTAIVLPNQLKVQ